MSTPDQAVPKELSLFMERVNRLLRTHIHDLQSPLPEEVQCLVYELEQRRNELEMQNEELLKTRQHLEAYRDRYVDLYDFAPLGYVTLDEDGYVQEINLAGTKLLNADRNELIGYPFAACVAKQEERVFLEHVQKCVGERQEVVSELTLVARGGRPIAVQLRSIPIAEPQMQVALCKTAITDITQRRNMEEAIRRSQVFLQTVIDAIPDAMLVIDLDYRVVLANRAARGLAAGIDPVASCLKCYRVLHAQDVPCQGEDTACPLGHVLATRNPAMVVHRRSSAGGEEVFAEINAAPVFDEAGKITHIIESCRDITDRQRAEESLKQERKLLRTLIDNLPDYVYVKDVQSRFIAANVACARIMGAPAPSDLLGKTDQDFYPEKLAAEYLADEQAILRCGQALVNKDEPHMDPAGGLRSILTTKVPFKDSQGKVVGLVGISRDITERKRAQEEAYEAQQRVLELQRREKELVEAELRKARDALVRQTRLATVGQLSVSIAHNLRNPLGSIRNAVFLLKRKLAPQESKCHEYLEIIQAQLLAANEVITAAMAISQGRPPSKRPVALIPILTQARSHLAAPEEIQWSYGLPSEPFIVSADAAQLEQVFKNLFLNSLQALGHAGKITVRAEHLGEYDEIVVGDDGPGIREDVRDRVFEPLVTTKTRGTGLGLTICRQIIQQHGGTIELLATDGPGAAFQIRLPSAAAAG